MAKPAGIRADDSPLSVAFNNPLLRAEGVVDFSTYSTAGERLQRDFFVPDDVFERIPTDVAP